ncbi:MAG: NrtA/SsuA/CpmA family ABC transporter substrate-binding protein [Anaerolineaceae bacterium]|nr:NrtA/SsuA/CpmA family ABC transporter substrate-binding protein [Anaerolineaceae bacterium]
MASVNVASATFIGDLPILIAQDMGYFQEQGLDIQLTETEAGRDSFQRLLDGTADIATVAETPLVTASFNQDDLIIVANLLYSNKINLIIARKDMGIQIPSDLKGKRVALYHNTNSEFLFDSYLLFNDIGKNELTILDMTPIESMEALVSGNVDAVVTWQPYIMRVQKQLGENAVLLPGTDIYTISWLVVAKKDYVEANPEIITAYLKALAKGETYLYQHPDQSIQLYMRRSGFEEEEVRKMISEIVYDLSLDESILITMEDQAKWMINTGKTTSNTMPNFLEMIDPTYLLEVKKSGVTIVK